MLEDADESGSKPVFGDISDIESYFIGKTVFVTGVTGSLGKLVVEKLLRSCGVQRVYVLVRPKKGKEPHERIKELFEKPAFEPLKKQEPNFSSKISLWTGDCLEPKLGLSSNDLEVLINDVHCIIHCAATVRFDATLRKATYINVRATWDLLKIAKEMKQLTSFVHVSTAYSHCPRREIDEVFYDPPMSAQKLLDLVESLNDDVLEAITPNVIKEWPNTYVFTKAIAEDVVKTEGKELPVSVVRPSVVLFTYKEPLPGWVDNFYGIIGISLACALGLLRSVRCEKKNIVDVVPLDYVVNVILAAAWNGRKKTIQEQIVSHRSKSSIYNCVSSVQNAINYETIVQYEYNEGLKIPTTLLLLYPYNILTNNVYLHMTCDFLFHLLPAYLVDLVLLCLGRKTVAVEGYKKYNKMAKVVVYFSTQEWKFKNANAQEMWNTLNAKDKELFEFDMRFIDWQKYVRVGMTGGRVFLLKDPLETLPSGKRKLFFLKIVHYILVMFFACLLYFLFKFLLSYLYMFVSWLYSSEIS